MTLSLRKCSRPVLCHPSSSFNPARWLENGLTRIRELRLQPRCHPHRKPSPRVSVAAPTAQKERSFAGLSERTLHYSICTVCTQTRCVPLSECHKANPPTEASPTWRTRAPWCRLPLPPPLMAGWLHVLLNILNREEYSPLSPAPGCAPHTCYVTHLDRRGCSRVPTGVYYSAWLRHTSFIPSTVHSRLGSLQSGLFQAELLRASRYLHSSDSGETGGAYREAGLRGCPASLRLPSRSPGVLNQADVKERARRRQHVGPRRR